jgi:drug/metabolite transporter (DMT)-like permease
VVVCSVPGRGTGGVVTSVDVGVGVGASGSAGGNRDLTFRAALATAALCVAFGANAVAIRLSVVSFGPLTLGGLRFCVSALIIAAWARLAGQPLRVTGLQRRRMLVFSFAFTVQIALLYVRVNRTLASRATLIGNLQPFLVLLLAHFFLPNERITLRRVVGMTLGFAGVSALFAEEVLARSSMPAGDLAVLAAVILWSGTTVYVKRIIDDYNIFQLALYPMIVSAPFLLAGGALWDDPMIGVITLPALGGFAYQALITAGIGFVGWNVLFKRHGAVALNSYLFLQPLAGVGLGALLLGEPVDSAGVLLGLPLVVLGIVIVNRRPTA